MELPLFKSKLISGEISLNDKDITSKTFKYYSNVFLNTKKYLKDSTQSAYINYVDNFNKTFGEILIKNLKISDIEIIYFH